MISVIFSFMYVYIYLLAKKSQSSWIKNKCIGTLQTAVFWCIFCVRKGTFQELLNHSQ